MNIDDYVEALKRSCGSNPNFNDTITTKDKHVVIKCVNGEIFVIEYDIKVHSQGWKSSGELPDYLRKLEKDIKSKSTDKDDGFQDLVKRIRRGRVISEINEE